MSGVIKLFKQFRSIFISEDILKENEEHANIVTAVTMLNMFIVCLITWILSYAQVFGLEKVVVDGLLIRAVFMFLVPAIICFVLKGRGKWLKYVLFVSYVLMLAISDTIMKFNITLIIVIPIILAARYYNKKFTILVGTLITITFSLSAFIGVKYGPQDLNSYNLVIPEGTTIVVDSTLRDAVTQIEVDENQRAIDVMIHLFIPKYLVYFIIAFACVQISQSGKNMIKKQKELSEEGARIESELNIANAIQKNMLPSIFPAFPEHKELDIYANMKPAKEVGGDFYDMFLIDENHLAMVIADVSGKGVPAALIMMITKTLIKNTALNGYSVEEVFYRVNTLLCEKNALNHFVTAWFGIFDLQTGKLEFVNAGHNPPLIYTKKENKFEYLKTKPNLILAAMKETKYKKHEMLLEPGDKLFLYTDGVTEATNGNNELYGEKRLQDYLNNHIDQDVETTIKGVKKDIDSFVENVDQFDDITMLEFLFKKRKVRTNSR